MRTSLSDLLQIAAVSAGSEFGRIGLTAQEIINRWRPMRELEAAE